MSAFHLKYSTISQGREYGLLAHLLGTGALALVDRLYVHWHLQHLVRSRTSSESSTPAEVLGGCGALKRRARQAVPSVVGCLPRPKLGPLLLGMSLFTLLPRVALMLAT